MADIIQFPMNVPQKVSDSYQRQNDLIYAQMTGLLNISLSNMDSAGEPKLLAGSVFALVDSLFNVPVEGPD
jgi:hypothetical protein